jgi:CRP-like cAMP-binding protein
MSAGFKSHVIPCKIFFLALALSMNDKQGLIALFDSFQILTMEEILTICEQFKSRSLAKNDFFVKEGDTSREVAFVKSGLFRSYHLNSKGEELTYCFTFPNNFLTAYSSFILEQSTIENLQALSKAELFVISKKEIEALSLQIPNLVYLLKSVAEYQYIGLEQRIFQLQRISAQDRYKELIENHPEFIQNIPLHYLASYLGITQRHLSRIRKEVVF